VRHIRSHDAAYFAAFQPHSGRKDVRWKITTQMLLREFQSQLIGITLNQRVHPSIRK